MVLRMALFKELSNKELVNGGVVPVAVVLGVPTLALGIYQAGYAAGKYRAQAGLRR